MHTDIFFIESEDFLLINAQKSLWASLGFVIQNCLTMHKFLNSVKFLFSCIFQISAWRVIACAGMFIAEM